LSDAIHFLLHLVGKAGLGGFDDPSASDFLKSQGQAPVGAEQEDCKQVQKDATEVVK
jgi:hypothetical protein